MKTQSFRMIPLIPKTGSRANLSHMRHSPTVRTKEHTYTKSQIYKNMDSIDPTTAILSYPLTKP